ncbi:MAG: metalloregulator ArsR/SmtB family transcription factor [Pseudomonadota bacterium]
MTNNQTSLDAVFHALADPTRRAVLRRLSEGPASVSDPARPFDMKLPTFLQHVRVLERSGLVRTEKAGRVRTCEMEPDRLASAEDWIREQRTLWEGRFDRLDNLLREDWDEET